MSFKGHVVEWFNTIVLKTITYGREFESHCVRVPYDTMLGKMSTVRIALCRTAS